jgi:Na+-driven multidrug efflux pump
MGLCALIFVVFRHQLIALFVKDGTPPEEVAELVRLGSMMLIATATFQIFDAGAMVTSGALRGAGDTLFPGVATIVSSWLIIVGGGFALLYAFPGLESLGAWMAASAYIIVLCLLLLGRFLAGHWKTIKLLPGSAPAPAGDGVTDGITPP